MSDAIKTDAAATEGCAAVPGSASAKANPRIVDCSCGDCGWSGRALDNDLDCPECGEEMRVDDRADDDWCKAQGWDTCQDCPDCGGSGERDGYGTFEQCQTCGGDGSIDW